MQQWYPDFFDRFGTLTVFDLLEDYLASGRIKVDKTAHPQRALYHDPCNYGRKSRELFGRGYFDQPRRVMDQCLAEWTDSQPSRGNQYCCGGGGGTLLTPFKAPRIHYGRRKIDQIKQARAELVVVPCHSCHGQIKALLAAYEVKGVEVKYLWEVVADALIVES